jgi:putative flippase GtrA
MNYPQLLKLAIRYGLVGAGVAICYSTLLVGLLQLDVVTSPPLAAAVAFIAVLPLSFVTHRSMSFHDAPRDSWQSTRFSSLALIGFVISVGGMGLMVDLLKLPYWTGLFLTWVCVPLSTFLVNALWVFPGTKRNS